MDFKFTRNRTDSARKSAILEGEIKRGLFQPACDGGSRDFSPSSPRKSPQKGWLGLNWPKEYGGKAEVM